MGAFAGSSSFPQTKTLPELEVSQPANCELHLFLVVGWWSDARAFGLCFGHVHASPLSPAKAHVSSGEQHLAGSSRSGAPSARPPALLGMWVPAQESCPGFSHQVGRRPWRSDECLTQAVPGSHRLLASLRLPEVFLRQASFLLIPEEALL